VRARAITVTPVLNGFLVKVGCQEVVVSSIHGLASEITRYYADPEAVENEYLNCAVNKPDLNVQESPAVGIGVAERIRDR
jgi:hypothetical protein